MKRTKLAFVGMNIKALREELGLSLRDMAKLAGVSHGVIAKYERLGLPEPLWSRIAEACKDHPDLRGSGLPAMEIFKRDLIVKSKLYSSLMATYGREKMKGILPEKSNQDILVDIGEKCKEFHWKESDINCIRIRLGLTPKKCAGNPKWKSK